MKAAQQRAPDKCGYSPTLSGIRHLVVFTAKYRPRR
jgi:hypothetical protein